MAFLERKKTCNLYYWNHLHLHITYQNEDLSGVPLLGCHSSVKTLPESVSTYIFPFVFHFRHISLAIRLFASRYSLFE